MKNFWRDLLQAYVMGLAVPWLIISITAPAGTVNMGQPEPTVTKIHQETPPESGIVIPVGTDHGVEEMNLEEYLVCVVLAEMPASFEKEALKAQTVVARTYTMRAHGGKSKHEDFTVCTDSTCCQAYCTPEMYLQDGGRASDLEKIREAVSETVDLVLVYEGNLIEATYFSCSGGRTEDAVAVWGTDVAYLQSVESPGEENAAHFRDTFVFTADEFAAKLSITPSGKPESWIGSPTYSEGGGVLEITICGKTFPGTQIRKLLGLPSAAFSVEVSGEEITVTTRGYGHRVGMSQYGADAMAAAGDDFREILAHYYPGTELRKMSD